MGKPTQQELAPQLAREQIWRDSLQMGDAVRIYHIPTGSWFMCDVTGITRHQIDVDTTVDLKEYTFDRTSGFGVHGYCDEDNEVAQEYVIRPV